MSKSNLPASMKDRNFGFAIVSALLLAAGIAWWRRGHVPAFLPIVGVLVVFISLVMPTILLPLNRLATKAMQLLLHVSNTVIILFVFYGLVTPWGLATRALRRRSMAATWKDDTRATYLTPVTRKDMLSNMRDMF